jgi:hypothetical protein
VKTISALITALSVPLMFLNLLGGIVSGIWLAILGEWGMLGLGVAFFLVSTWILSFAMIPSLLLIAPAVNFAEKGKTLGLVCFGALSSLYTLALMTVWCCGVLFLFVKDAGAGNLIARLVWSYGIATGPWAYMASKEQGPGDEASASFIATFLAELAYLVVMVVVAFSSITLVGAVELFGCFMLVSLIVQTSFAVIIQRESARVGYTQEQVDCWNGESQGEL